MRNQTEMERGANEILSETEKLFPRKITIYPNADRAISLQDGLIYLTLKESDGVDYNCQFGINQTNTPMDFGVYVTQNGTLTIRKKLEMGTIFKSKKDKFEFVGVVHNLLDMGTIDYYTYRFVTTEAYDSPLMLFDEKDRPTIAPSNSLPYWLSKEVQAGVFLDLPILLSESMVKMSKPHIAIKILATTNIGYPNLYRDELEFYGMNLDAKQQQKIQQNLMESEINGLGFLSFPSWISVNNTSKEFGIISNIKKCKLTVNYLLTDFTCHGTDNLLRNIKVKLCIENLPKSRLRKAKTQTA